MFNYVLTGVLILYFIIIVFAGIERIFGKDENDDQEAE